MVIIETTLHLKMNLRQKCRRATFASIALYFNFLATLKEKRYLKISCARETIRNRLALSGFVSAYNKITTPFGMVILKKICLFLFQKTKDMVARH